MDRVIADHLDASTRRSASSLITGLVSITKQFGNKLVLLGRYDFDDMLDCFSQVAENALNFAQVILSRYVSVSSGHVDGQGNA